MADSIYLYDKAAGLTSFEALRPIKRLANTGKVGHTGTLDRFATGLLVVLTGRLTRLNPLFSGLDKRYEATIRFGEETETLDPEGSVVRTGAVPERTEIESVLPCFLGEITQTPPTYSAVHVNGRRAHNAARSGERVEIPQRMVSVLGLELLRYEPPDLSLRIHCSTGTYIRSLARDIGHALDSAASVAELRRVAVGPYAVEEAVSEDQLQTAAASLSLRAIVSRLPGVGTVNASALGLKKLRHGGVVSREFFEEDPSDYATVAVFDAANELVAVLDVAGDSFKYRLVVPEQRARS